MTRAEGMIAKDQYMNGMRMELLRAGLFDSEADYGNGAIARCVLELLETWHKQGHSGGSAMMTLEIFDRLVRHKTLSPITDDPAEWMDVAEYQNGEALWQNRRQSLARYRGGLGLPVERLDRPRLPHGAPVRERPIIFSGEMVRAILEGRKTQTRRVVGIQPIDILLPKSKTANALGRVTRKWNDKRVWFSLTEQGATPADNHGKAFHCRWGEVGERLWVRETWAQRGEMPAWIYKADEVRAVGAYGCVKWRSPIHMKREASRLQLEITSARIERVQSITKDDCIAEGLKIPCNEQHRPLLQLSGKYPACSYPPFNSRATIQKATLEDYFRAYYASLWDTLNAQRGYGWDVNPWVWVIEFKRPDA